MKKVIYLAIYKNTKKTILDYLIFKWQTICGFKSYSKYTHCEIIIDDDWLSSSFIDGGVRSKKIEPRLGNWDYIPIEVEAKDILDIKEFFNVQIGKKYDLKNIFLAQILNLDKDCYNKWICSEISAEMINISNCAYLYYEPHRYSPARLVRELVEVHNKTITNKRT